MSNTRQYTTVIVGSGLAGLTTTLNLLEKDQNNRNRVILIEKCNKLGGNSVKASSGINGVPTIYQTKPDSIDDFYADSIKSGKGLNNDELVHILTRESSDAINWLTQDMKIDLSEVTQLGGHSNPRTHKGEKLPPGFAIISALTKRLQELEEKKPEAINILKETELTKIVYKDGIVKGVEYKQNESADSINCDNLVLATGGFSADSRTQNSLLVKYRPDLIKFPTSNGIQTTGDGQKLAVRDCNAKLIDMDKIQIHPTGFIKIDSPNDCWKFLCGELIRGIGGILLDSNGERFTNELGTRDHVTNDVLEHCKLGNNELGLPEDSVASVIVVSHEDYLKAKNHINFYASQKLLTKGSYIDLYNLLKKLNSRLSISVEELEQSIKSVNRFIKKEETDAIGRIEFGNSFNNEFYFGLTTPVLHFTMGGIQTTTNNQVVTCDNQVIPNLYAVGEVSGGVHGANRLGGSSLLECVVFGKRVSLNILDK
ncbi:unnamed protein product [Candida verbasci]|uniref:Fumarate reductase n=1 Tax=Candida verbasci TaxID=1227364 RepID=A0A9W4XJX1_9ASCO|nr:unnamed protein product [Candida verbasci]